MPDVPERRTSRWARSRSGPVHDPSPFEPGFAVYGQYGSYPGKFGGIC